MNFQAESSSALVTFLVITSLIGCEKSDSRAIESPAPAPKTQTTGDSTNGVLSQAEPSAPNGTEQELEDGYVTFPSEGVKVRRPEGFTKAQRFSGFQQNSTGSSILVIKVPAPFTKVTKSFTKEGFTENATKTGLTFREREDSMMDGNKTTLIHLDQFEQGKHYSKWLFALGDDEKTILVTANFLKEHETSDSKRLRDAVLSTRFDDTLAPSPSETAGFTIQASGGLAFSHSMGRGLLYSLGASPRSPGDPIFIAGPAHSDFPIANVEEFAKQRLNTTPQWNIKGILSSSPVEVDALKGHELTASATDQKGNELRIYLVILPTDGSYIIVLASVGLSDSPKYLPVFRSMASSLHRIKK